MGHGRICQLHGGLSGRLRISDTITTNDSQHPSHCQSFVFLVIVFLQLLRCVIKRTHHGAEVVIFPLEALPRKKDLLGELVPYPILSIQNFVDPRQG